MRQVLVARGDAIGDTLLSLPAIHALHAGWPDARLTVISSPAAAPVLADDPAIDTVVLTGAAPAARFDAAFTFTEKKWGYDSLGSAPVRVGFWPGRSKPLKSVMLLRRLTHRVPSREDPTQDQGIHEVERYYRLLQAVGINAAPGPIRMAVSAADRAWADAEVQRRDVSGYVGLHLSEKWTRQGWSLDFLQRLVRKLDAVVLYGPAEADWATRIEARQHFFEPSLKRYAAFLSHARLLVSMDTSAVHVAASEGVPVVDVFPGQNFEHNSTRWRPWMVGHALVQRSDWSPPNEESFSAAVLQAVEQVQKAQV